MAQPALALRDLVKTFGATRALDNANLVVERGAIHGLIGQNGAGKSTIIKILGGLYKADSGSVTIDGQTLTHVSPRAIEHLGIHIIHQEALLVPSFTVAEALFLGAEPGIGPLLSRRTMRKRAEDIIGSYFDMMLPRDALIGELSAAHRQIVQITRALLNRPAVLVFDEPTASLVRREAHRLFGLIRRLRDEGTSIVYISHYLEEVQDLCDKVTVLRNGRDVATLDPRDTPLQDIVSLMINREIGDMFPKSAVPIGKPALSVQGLTRRGHFTNVDFTLHAGEILGLTGLVGSGAKEVLAAIFGLAPADQGSITTHGKQGAVGSPAGAIRRGLGLVPEDRRGQGIALDMSVRENTTLASLGKLTRFGFISRRREAETVRQLIARLGIKTPGPDARVRDLSGGNQQKVVLAKWLSAASDIYLLDEPTVAIDVAAKVEIYRLLGDLAQRGAAVLILSSDLLELQGICDRILVLHRGRITHRLRPADTTPEEILAAATGAAGLGESIAA
ncbi:sugar ABC transporter ATP-binding protein [Acidisoma cellulosilytica]|uniref:Sugar ABC transporter ATP-binding protein n=1 Tax=Acidisoma cellulosilyticum TaxID=2802395 RepID=A0A963Z551_9PROT|nr:sugar ABC transporter ATP-binding protein [Acidisoma cellulosilyticum]MCB8882215.1 sugar ABC transporter ATP-binding protein [Acidisoma cellulosilyticum]